MKSIFYLASVFSVVMLVGCTSSDTLSEEELPSSIASTEEGMAVEQSTSPASIVGGAEEESLLPLASFVQAAARDPIISLSDSEKKYLLQYAYSVLEESFDEVFEGPEQVPEIDDYERIYITFLTNNTLRCSQSGSADKNKPDRTKLDIYEAVDDCIHDERFGGELEKEEVSDTKIVFNILYNKRIVVGDLDTLSDKIELGIHAIEVKNGGKRAFFKESVPISKNYDLEKTLERLCKKAKLSDTCYDDSETNVFIYDTVSFTGDRDGSVSDLYRYNTLIDAEEIDAQLLRKRLELVVEWLLNNVNTDTGTMEYKYYPSKDKYSSDNNHVRQLATLWAIAMVRNALNDIRLDPVAESTFEKNLEYVECKNGYCFVDIDGKAVIAFNAFLILSLLETPDYPEADSLMRQLAKGIILQQQDNGSYNTCFNSDKNSGVDYYPGEAMFALMRLYEETRESEYLNSVYKAFPYYRDYWRGNKNTAFVPWHSQADLLLYRETEYPEVADFVFEINDWLIDNHQIRESEYLDYVGGFPRGVPRNSTSVYMEGINDAYTLARLVGDEEHIKKYEESIRLGIRFSLLTQYTPENAFYIANQDRAVGGFRKTLLSNDQRIDYTQHASLAIMKAIENGIF